MGTKDFHCVMGMKAEIEHSKEKGIVKEIKTGRKSIK